MEIGDLGTTISISSGADNATQNRPSGAKTSKVKIKIQLRKRVLEAHVASDAASNVQGLIFNDLLIDVCALEASCFMIF